MSLKYIFPTHGEYQLMSCLISTKALVSNHEENLVKAGIPMGVLPKECQFAVLRLWLDAYIFPPYK